MTSAAVVLPSHGGHIVRRARTTEIEAAWDLGNAVSTAAHWSRAEYETYCVAGQQAETQAKALFVVCAPTQHSPESSPGNIVGFAAFSAVPNIGAGECELENMVVAQEWRRQGLGLRLLASGLLWCRAWCSATPGAGLWLEVRASNRGAISFYERAGFAVAGGRPAYYTRPEEDAVLMSRPLGSPLPAC